MLNLIRAPQSIQPFRQMLNEPRQSLVDPGVNLGFESDYGFEIFRGIRPTKRVFVARMGFKGFNQRDGKVLAHVKVIFCLDDL
jgi:hypothetical protein